MFVLMSSLFSGEDNLIDENIIETPQVDTVPTPELVGEQAIPLQAYRINTQCELLYSMSYAVYPNGENLQHITLSGIVNKYPDDYEQWSEILSDDEKRMAFFENGLPQEFASVFASSVMKEYSMNPELKSTVILITDTQREAKLQQVFDDNNCQEYNDGRLNNIIP